VGRSSHDVAARACGSRACAAACSRACHAARGGGHGASVVHGRPGGLCFVRSVAARSPWRTAFRTADECEGAGSSSG
jgi:hypothetical protein